MMDRLRQIAFPGFEDHDIRSYDADKNPQKPTHVAVESSSIANAPFSAADKEPTFNDNNPVTADNEIIKNLSGKSVWVVDAHSLIHQVFHAMHEMRGPNGEPVGAIFGFTRDMFFLLEEKKPDYLFCAFDMPGKTFRHDMYQGYKIDRPPMDENLIPQIASIRRVLDTLGIPALGCEGFEADDLLATIAKKTDELEGRCVIVTSDKDCRQLITDRVQLYNIRKDSFIGRDELKADWGITPEQVTDYQAMVGDSVDSIPGVPLIGPKFATQLLGQYGTLESVLEHAKDVSGTKRRENLIKFRDQALMSRELARLNINAPITIPWQCPAGRINRSAATALFGEFGFHSMTRKIDSMS
jgi:DNA polymerase I